MNFKDNFLKKEDGFTLLEVMISLSVTSLCFILLSMSVSQIKSMRQGINTDKQIEWHLFINQIENYLQGSTFIDNYGDRLVVQELIEDSYQEVHYMKTDNFFIRRVNNGTQPLLTDIQSVRFSVDQDDLIVNGDFYNGEQYHGRIEVNSWSGQDE